MVDADQSELAIARLKTEFLATLAHELRNPLAPIANGLHLLHTADLGPQQDGIVRMLQRQVDTMVRLIEDLLDVSRLNEGDITLRRERVELSSVLTAAIETSQPRIDARNHRLVVTQLDHVMLLADRVRLCQVFANLLNNAAGHVARDGTIWLTVTRDNPTGDIVVAVRDSGPSLPDDQLAELAVVFDAPRDAWPHAHSIGVGLALVHQLVRLHGGSIRVSAGPDQVGTEFQVRLPAQDGAGEAPVAAAPSATDDRAFHGRRILVVDDNHDAADSLAMLLRHHGANTAVVYSGMAALDVLDRFAPEVVLLDLNMPGLDGYQVATRIRSRPEYRTVLVVAQTGWGQHHDGDASARAGIDHHLVKPLDLRQLGHVIERHFGGDD